MSQPEEIEFFRFKSLVPDAKARLINSKFEESKYDNNTSLLVCSSLYGYFIAGTLDGFVFGQSEKLRDAIDTAEKGQKVDFTNYTEIKAGNVTILSSSLDELELFVGLKGGTFLVYDIYDIVHQKEQAQPKSTYQFDNEFNAILPNPTLQDLIAISLENSNTCALFSPSSSTVTATLHDITSTSWLPEGDQIVCGCKDGSIKVYDKSGIERDTFPLHDNVKDVFEETGLDDLKVSGIFCVAQGEILVIYSTTADNNFLFHFSQNQITYIEQVEGAFVDVYPKPYFHFKLLSNFGPNIQYLVTILNASSLDITLFGKETGKGWARWVTAADNGIPEMPLNEDSQDTYPVGAAIDLSVSKPLPPVDPSMSDVPVPPMPIFFFLTTDGVICAYHMYNSVLAEENLKFQDMVAPKGVAAITKPLSTTAPLFFSSAATTTMGKTLPPSGFSFSSAAKTMIDTPSSFNNTMSGGSTFGNTTAFGSSSFGNTTFGSSNFGSAAPSAVQTVSFASLAKSTPNTSSSIPSSTQSNLFKPASLTSYNNAMNQSSSSISNNNMFSSSVTKRTTADIECSGFELGGFSKALESDDNDDESQLVESLDEEEESQESSDEEEEEEEESQEVERKVTPSSTCKQSNHIFATYQKKEMTPNSYERVAKHPSAKTIEDAYFDTLQEMEQMISVQNTLQDKIQFLSKTTLITQHTFDQHDYQWRLGDMDGIAHILDASLMETTKTLEQDSKSSDMLTNTMNRDDQVIQIFSAILDLMKQQDDKKLEKIVKLANELIMAPIDLHTFNETLYKKVKDTLESFEPKLLSSNQPKSIPSLYALRQAIRHIDTTLNRYNATINSLSNKSLKPVDLDQSETLGQLFEAVKGRDLVQKTSCQI
ncbi:hypothetical protein K501DRAFT_334808 [Backusella circina FSU 941]|nr:hypothetical protein K501DRAFT_334808 [Backusella circina FSU 941]